jgi:hypothetical protein
MRNLNMIMSHKLGYDGDLRETYGAVIHGMSQSSGCFPLSSNSSFIILGGSTIFYFLYIKYIHLSI